MSSSSQPFRFPLPLLSLLLLLLPSSVFSQTYCALPLAPGNRVQNRSWEQYGPNGPMCGELRGWAMSHGCFASGNPNCAPTAPCDAGKCFCIYACEPGYCMTQFNPSKSNIGDPSHGVLCNADGTLTKVYNPAAPWCVPCASQDPRKGLSGPTVTANKSISPATIVTNMTSGSVAACGLIDPGVDDNLIYGVVSRTTKPLHVSMFPTWWYLKGVDAQAYFGPLNVPANYFCVAKRSPDSPPPQGNAGFFSVLYTTGGKITNSTGNNGRFLAFGQAAFFGDYGNFGNQNLARCWKHLGSKCIPKYGIRGWVCGPGQVIQPNATNPNQCSLQCDIYWKLLNAPGADGSQAQLCRRMPKCNLAQCPDPNKCLAKGEMMGCSPVADVTAGQRIVYELYSTAGL